MRSLPATARCFPLTSSSSSLCTTCAPARASPCPLQGRKCLMRLKLQWQKSVPALSLRLWTGQCLPGITREKERTLQYCSITTILESICNAVPSFLLLTFLSSQLYGVVVVLVLVFPPEFLRFGFYDKARSAFAVVQTAERRPYGCFLLQKVTCSNIREFIDMGIFSFSIFFLL